MELVLNGKRAKLFELVSEALRGGIAAAPEIRETEEPVFVSVCDNFAYKRTLLFYTEQCACCRYARKLTAADGSEQMICACGHVPERREIV